MNNHNIPQEVYQKYLESAEDLIAYGYNYGMEAHDLADKLIIARINRAKEENKLDKCKELV